LALSISSNRARPQRRRRTRRVATLFDREAQFDAIRAALCERRQRPDSAPLVACAVGDLNDSHRGLLHRFKNHLREELAAEPELSNHYDIKAALSDAVPFCLGYDRDEHRRRYAAQLDDLAPGQLVYWVEEVFNDYWSRTPERAAGELRSWLEYLAGLEAARGGQIVVLICLHSDQLDAKCRELLDNSLFSAAQVHRPARIERLPPPQIDQAQVKKWAQLLHTLELLQEPYSLVEQVREEVFLADDSEPITMRTFYHHLKRILAEQPG